LLRYNYLFFAEGSMKHPILQVFVLLSFLGLLFVPSSSRAEDEGEKPEISFSGFVDTYYSYSFNAPPDNTVSTRVFDVDHNSFALSLAELAADISYKSVYGRIDLNFGQAVDPRDTGIIGVNNNYFDIQQGYVGVSFDLWGDEGENTLSVEMGKMATHIGYEVIESFENVNYTRSYLFGNPIPFGHEGLRLNLGLYEKYTFQFNIYNSTSFDGKDNNGFKTFGVLIGIAPADELSVVLNWVGGNENDPGTTTTAGHTVEANISSTISEKLTLGVGWDYAFESGPNSTGAFMTGIAGYISYPVADWYTLAFRGEYMTDSGNGTGFFSGVSTGNTIREITLTQEVAIKTYLVLRLDYRYDWATEAIFVSSVGVSSTGFSKNQHSLTFGAVTKF